MQPGGDRSTPPTWPAQETACKKALDTARIAIPYPQLAVHFDGQDLPLLAPRPSPSAQPVKPH